MSVSTLDSEDTLLTLDIDEIDEMLDTSDSDSLSETGEGNPTEASRRYFASLVHLNDWSASSSWVRSLRHSGMCGMAQVLVS